MKIYFTNAELKKIEKVKKRGKVVEELENEKLYSITAAKKEGGIIFITSLLIDRERSVESKIHFEYMTESVCNAIWLLRDKE